MTSGFGLKVEWWTEFVLECGTMTASRYSYVATSMTNSQELWDMLPCANSVYKRVFRYILKIKHKTNSKICFFCMFWICLMRVFGNDYKKQ